MNSMSALVAAIAAALFLSSCSSPPSDGHADHDHGSESSVQPAQSNTADVAFATDMIPHHQQALQMSGLVPGRSTDPAVITLAAEIAAAQGPEIETMKAFLVQWNAGEDAGHQDHGDDGGAMNSMDGMEMQGMVDDATMGRLESLKGTEFDRLFLQSMIGHHEGAIVMANTELSDGVNADAKALARQIVATQQAELDQMKQMLVKNDG